MGSMLEFGAVGAESDLRLYISGDTLMYGGIAEIRRRFPHIDLGLVHLGGTRLLRLLMVTMDGRQGADWLNTVQCATVVPIHYDDYTVMTSGLSDFQTEARRRGVADRIRPLERGHSLSLISR
jgi:L-ascorbate metabolism protein UlaG (beta-lactamase superfamily)